MTTNTIRAIIRRAAIAVRPAAAETVADLIESYDDESIRDLARHAREFVEELVAECDEIEAERRREAEEDAELAAQAAAWQANRERLDSICDAIDAALGLNREAWYVAHTGSRYTTYRTIEIRVSDHEAPTWGGYNPATGERYGNADVEFLAADGVPTRAAIRSAVAAALREQ